MAYYDDDGFWECDRCNREFHREYDEMRDWNGVFRETRPDGSSAEYGRLCEDCRFNDAVRRIT